MTPGHSRAGDTIPQGSPAEIGCSWLGWECCWLRGNLAGWLGPKGVGNGVISNITLLPFKTRDTALNETQPVFSPGKLN